MRKQSFITILLTVLMSIVGVQAFAHDIEVANSDGVTIYYVWINNNTELAVSYRGSYEAQYSNEYSGNIVIPESVVYEGNTYSVTSIGASAFYNCSGLTSVTIPNSVISIGAYAFNGTEWYNNQSDGILYLDKWLIGCKGTKPTGEIKILEGTKGIAAYAFSDCNSLTSVIIPNSVTSIDIWAFYNCSNLTSINIPNNLTSISDYAFYGCSGLTSLNIPPKVTLIRDYAFCACRGLSSVVIPNSVITIGQSAFNDCSGLTSVVIGNGVTSIKSSAFNNTNIKKTIWLTNTPPAGYNYAAGTVNYVSNDQFSSLSNTVKYQFLSSYFDVDGIRYVPVSPSDRTCDAIDCKYDENAANPNITSTVVYKGVTMNVRNLKPYLAYNNKYIKTLTVDIDGELPSCAFTNCSNIQSVSLGQKVSAIGSNAFQYCTSLETIKIPDIVTVLNDYSFADCTSLKEIKIGSQMKTINQYAFSGCNSLPSITIPNAVTNIHNYVFNGCTSIKKVIIADSESTLTFGSNGNNPIFSSCPLDYVYIGRDINYGTSSSTGYSPFYRNTTLREVKITDKETEISENEFYGCSNLQSVTIGDGVTTIGKWAFSGCSSLKFFAFGSKLESIGQEAFSDCAAVVEISSKAQVAPVCGSQALDDINKWECKLYVPDGCMATYEAAEQWKDFFFKEEGEGTTGQESGTHFGEDKKCETPTITIDGNSVKFGCKTNGVIFHYTLTSSEAKSDITNSGIEVKNNYTITVYASKEGYIDSDVVQKDIQIAAAGKLGDLNNDGKVDVADHVKLSDIIMNQ